MNQKLKQKSIYHANVNAKLMEESVVESKKGKMLMRV